MNHTSLTPNDKEFWDFSFQEMGEIDLPAMVEYVLKVRFSFSDRWGRLLKSKFQGFFVCRDWLSRAKDFLQSNQNLDFGRAPTVCKTS